MRHVIQKFRRHLVALAAIVLIGFSPFIPVVVAGILAHLNGCQLDEGSTHPCVILGLDFGGALYMMGVMGWFGLATLPAAAFLLLVWAAWIVVSLLSPLRPVKR